MSSRARRLVFSADRRRVDFRAVREFLSRRSYWAKGRPAAVQRRANANSLCVGLYDGRRQAAFARVITDFATYAYLCDVFVLEEYRGRGLGKRLVAETLALPRLKSVKSWALLTTDAQGLYAKFGFEHLKDPRRFMLSRRSPCHSC